jgi:hypothetical protein
MPHDPELVAETRAWLLKANGDLGAAAAEFTAEVRPQALPSSAVA